MFDTDAQLMARINVDALLQKKWNVLTKEDTSSRISLVFFK